MIVVLMGVAGAGKTTIGRKLAVRLGAEFIDADDLHTPDDVRKMAAGTGLTDEDRAPWLERVRREIIERERADASAVLACSALKESHRRVLLDGTRRVQLVYLRAAPAVLERRLVSRQDHFLGPELLAGQLEALEEPNDAVTLDTSGGPEATVAALAVALAVGAADADDV